MQTGRQFHTLSSSSSRARDLFALQQHPLTAILVSAGQIATLIGTAVPNSSNFFINFVITQGIAMIPFRLMYPHIGVLVGLFRLLGICGG